MKEREKEREEEMRRGDVYKVIAIQVQIQIKNNTS